MLGKICLVLCKELFHDNRDEKKLEFVELANSLKKHNHCSRAQRDIGPGGFIEALGQIISDDKWDEACGFRRTARGRPAQMGRVLLLRAYLFHLMNTAGTFAQHLLALTGLSRSESTLSERRQALPWEVFSRLMGAGLKARATRKKHPQCFYRPWRLLALDGAQFSLSNTPKNLRAGKARSTGGGLTGFAKLHVAVLLEVGLHNPVAAAVGRPGQSEWSLSLSLLSHLPKNALLLGDRLYGCAYFIWSVLQNGGQCLVRVKEQFGVKPIGRRFKDGSQLVEVPVRDRKVPKKIIQTMRLREIRVRIQRPGFKARVLRFWTTLLDPKTAPALELARLYTQRWEEELYFRQLKIDLRRGDLLQSQTPETAMQEVAAMIICTALVAHYRTQAAQGEVSPLQISFGLTLEMLRPFWLMAALGQDILSPATQNVLLQRTLQYLLNNALKPRRIRTCLRGVRQRRKGWPKITKPISCTQPVTCEIFNTSYP